MKSKMCRAAAATAASSRGSGRPLILLVLGLILLPACTTTTESLLASRGRGGSVFTYPADYDRVFNSAVEAARSRKLKMIRRDRKEGLLLASDTIHWLNGGGRIALFFTRVGPSETRVEILSKPYVFIPSPTIYWSARKRTTLIDEGIRERVASS